MFYAVIIVAVVIIIAMITLDSFPRSNHVHLSDVFLQKHVPPNLVEACFKQVRGKDIV